MEAMTLEVLLPFRVFAAVQNVTRLVAAGRGGSFGLLPHRLDCVAALAPGLLVYQVEGADEVCLAVDEGVLVKTGLDVHVSVRRAIAGADLQSLRASIEHEFLTLDEDERKARAAIARMETGFLQRFAELRRE